MRNTSITIALAVAVVLCAPITARAEESCDGWFCDKPNALNGEAVDIERHDGSVVHGVVIEIAIDHVTIMVDTTKVTIAWDQIASFRVSTGSAQKTPEPEHEEEPAVDDDEDVVVVEEKPKAEPPPAKEVPEQAPVIAIAERPPFSLGARLKVMAGLEDARFHRSSELINDYVTGGLAYEISFGLRLSRSLYLRTSYEHAELFRGERNQMVEALPTSDALGIGLRTLFGDAPVRGVFEVGVGYRWLHVPYAAGAAPDRASRAPRSGSATFEGADTLRLALGSTFAVDEHGRFELLLETVIGRFSHVEDDNADARSYGIPETSRTNHAFVGISFGIELNP
jgi:hypothetical protein